ncbi:MAG: SDR family oxidoreductase [Planctomycetota bacterium]
MSRPRALVTGGLRRVGRQIALTLAQAGCDLIVTTRRDADGTGIVEEAAEHGAAVAIRRLDPGDPEQTEVAANTIVKEFDRIDILVHNASNYFPTPLTEASPGPALDLYKVNALSPLLLTKHLAPKLAASPLPGRGAVISMVDIHAMGRPRSGFAPYAMAKAALVEMVRSLARELAPEIRVNGVAPGVVAWPDEGYESDEASQETYLGRVPLARPGTPTDAAETVRWLAFNAHYTTGQIIRVDGGRWLT